MKKLFSVLAGICLAVSVAGNAAADFTFGANSTLALSVYNEATNVEKGYDLGIINETLDISAANLLLGTIDVSDKASTVALYSANNNDDAFFGLTTDTATGASGPVYTNFKNSITDIWNIGYMNQTSPVSIDASNVRSASTKFGTNGAYSGVVSGAYSALMPSLAALDTVGYIDIYLYQYEYFEEFDFDTMTETVGMTLLPGADATTDYTAILRIENDGDVLLNPIAAPVPGALVLISTGLLGMVGIKRKKA